ncbi:hypothetical protein EXU48_11855 [Occultella glacieicola]|uniref:Uncharacterized protein n=1 Tax=Occultella glacieicola TaxID=2518684 RepID=A0ABY2E5L1_9MICO|nr:hypothetical protein [Occultella glacieicola]TDE94132.1 hypothetical protein EXU48_11855 [Occultella glacieicola]
MSAAATRGDGTGPIDGDLATVRASATIVHPLTEQLRDRLTHPRWGNELLVDELIEAITLLVTDDAGLPLAEPRWRYEVTAVGMAVNRRGRVTRRPEVAVFAPEDLPEQYRGLLQGPETLFARISSTITDSLDSSRLVD